MTVVLRPLLRVAEGELMIIEREAAGGVLRCMSDLSPIPSSSKETHRMVPVVSLEMDLCPATGFHAITHQAMLTAPSKPVWA